jgi:hypothetical protein
MAGGVAKINWFGKIEGISHHFDFFEFVTYLLDKQTRRIERGAWQ